MSKIAELTSIPIPRFQSFIAAGFECTAALAENHRRLDLLAATKHDSIVFSDYQLLKQVGITTVREGLSWSQIDHGQNQYDFSRFLPLVLAGQQIGIQQIWDLNHFDYPEDLDPFNLDFLKRFAEYAQKAIQFLRQYQQDTLYIVPLNEISFFAWIGADRGWWAPHTVGQAKGFQFKTQLVKAAIAAMESIWQVDQNVRFIQVDPFMRRLATLLRYSKKFGKKNIMQF